MPEPLTRHQLVVPAAELLETGPDYQQLPGALRRQAGRPELHPSNRAGCCFSSNIVSYNALFPQKQPQSWAQDGCAVHRSPNQRADAERG